MASVLISITSDHVGKYDDSTQKTRLWKELCDGIMRVVSGQDANASIVVIPAASPAAGVLTCGTVAATNTCTVLGQVLTAVASNPAANQFLAGAPAVAGADLARAINEATETKDKVLAVHAGAGVVNITALAVGPGGNEYVLAGGTNITLTTQFTGGAGTAARYTF